jgi:hypothetical protein
MFSLVYNSGTGRFIVMFSFQVVFHCTNRDSYRDTPVSTLSAVNTVRTLVPSFTVHFDQNLLPLTVLLSHDEIAFKNNHRKVEFYEISSGYTFAILICSFILMIILNICIYLKQSQF